MTIKQLPPAARKSVNKTVRQLGIQAYDCDNLYPQNVRDIVGAVCETNDALGVAFFAK